MSGQNNCTSSPPIDLNSLRSRIVELTNFDEASELGPEEEKLLKDFSHELESKINWGLSECSSNLSLLPSEDLKILRQLKKELLEVESENAGIDCEIEELERRCMEDFDTMDSELEKLSCWLEFIESQTPMKANEQIQMDVSCHALDQADTSNAHGSKFKMLKLSHQIEKNKTTLETLRDLDSIFKRFEAVEKFEDGLTGLRIIDIEGNSIRLSLKTYIPYLESVLHHQDIESVIEPLEVNHELIIETVDGTWELKDVEIFPNDVYIGEIIDAAQSIRQLYPMFSVIKTRSCLEWFVRRVQDRIALSSLRRFVINNSNKSRHSFGYLDREDMLVAHVVGVDAFIKLPQGWPLSDLPLELISLKSTSQYSKEISLSFLCKIVEAANSLNPYSRRKISSFVDGIEEILMQQIRAEQTSTQIVLH